MENKMSFRQGDREKNDDNSILEILIKILEKLP